MKNIKTINPFIYISLLGGVGLVSSFWQTAEKIHSLKNPDAVLSCNINPIVDCGSVLGHELSAVFGVPNSMIGMVMFTLIIALSLVFVARRKQPRLVAMALLSLNIIALAFSVWFFAVSLYVINKICIFCIFIWGATIPMTVLTLREFEGELFKSKARMVKSRALLRNRPLQYVVAMYALAIGLFLFRFRDYYF